MRKFVYAEVTEIKTYSVEVKTDEEAVEKLRKTIEIYDDGENIIEKCLKKGMLKVEIEKQ